MPKNIKKRKKKNMNIQNVETDLNNLIKRLTVSDANNDMITPDSSENEDRVSPTNISNVITDISDVSGNL